LKPRRNPLLHICDEPGGVVALEGTGRQLRLEPAARELLIAVDGRSTVAELARSVAMEPSKADAILQKLAAARLVHIDLPVPSTEVDAFAALRQLIDELQPQARVCAKPWLDAAEELRDGFERTSWPARKHWFERAESWVASTLGDNARRKDGNLYADRLVLYED